LKPRAVDASGRVVRFEDGSDLEVDALIWATGYRPDYAWIELPVLDPDGRVLHRRGVTDVPGLYLLGLTWQHTRGSALIGWVKDDAAFIAEQIGTFDDRRNKPAIDTRVSGEEAQRAGAGAGTRED
jgi:putative flavoprotein involved in K+ transport